jgi:hypothetical protein
MANVFKNLMRFNLWESYESMASNKLDDSNFSGDEWRGEGAIDGEDGEGRL